MTPSQTYILEEIRSECRKGELADDSLLFAELRIGIANKTGVSEIPGLPTTYADLMADLNHLAAKRLIERSGDGWRPVHQEPKKERKLF